MADNYIAKINQILSKPIIPEKIEKEKLSQPVAFPDADATEEEISEYLKSNIAETE